LKKFKSKFENRSKQPEQQIKGHKGVKKISKEEQLYGGELEDLWGSKKDVKSKNF